MTALLYILTVVVFIQSVTIIYLMSRDVQNDKKTKELVSNQSKIAQILTLYSKKLKIGEKNSKNDNNIYLN